jgi:predicted site-specific integrase-resolvase
MISNKRFVTIKEYQKIAGLSYKTVDHLLNSGQLPFITTQSGLRRVDTQPITGSTKELKERLDKQEQILNAICEHFGVRGVGSRR